MEVNSKDYGLEPMKQLAETYNADKILQTAGYAHMYVFEWENRIIGVGAISSFWGSETESILLTIFVQPELQGKGVGRQIIRTLESDELFTRANRIEIPASVTATEFYRKCGYEYKNGIKELITCSASEVLQAGHGICFAKSHLLVALLRCKEIPSGFCYQKLILDDDTAPVLIYHGLIGVYIKELNKWVRLDARGNKEGVNAQFSIEEERLAFPIRPELGEVDDYTVYPNPDEKVLERLQKYETRPQLWENLPAELAYHTDEK